MKVKSHLLGRLIKGALVGGFLANLVACASVQGNQWVGFTDVLVNDEQRLYLDKSSVVTPDGQPNWRQVKVLAQADLDTNEESVESSAFTITIDCENVTARRDSYKIYEQSWAQGDVVYSADPDEEFRTVEFDSDSDDMKSLIDLYRKVCKK